MKKLKSLLKLACEAALDDLSNGEWPRPEGVLASEGRLEPGECGLEVRVLLRVTHA